MNVNLFIRKYVKIIKDGWIGMMGTHARSTRTTALHVRSTGIINYAFADVKHESTTAIPFQMRKNFEAAVAASTIRAISFTGGCISRFALIQSSCCCKVSNSKSELVM